MNVRSLNKVMLIGNLTKDPVLKYTASGTPVCTFTVATNRAWKSNDGERKEEASFHRVAVWANLAEVVSKLLKKGHKVYIEGIITYRERRDENGELLCIGAEIRADQVVLLSSRGSSTSDDATDDSSDESDNKDETDDEVEGGSIDVDDIVADLEEDDKEDEKSAKSKEQKGKGKEKPAKGSSTSSEESKEKDELDDLNF